MKGRIPGGFEGALFCILKNASQTYASLREWHRGVSEESFVSDRVCSYLRSLCRKGTAKRTEVDE